MDVSVRTGRGAEQEEVNVFAHPVTPAMVGVNLE